MKKFITAFALLQTVLLPVIAQHSASPATLSSAGGFYANTTHSNSSTIGQIAITLIGNTAHKLTQGFQQPFENDLSISGIIKTENNLPVPGVTVSLSGSAVKAMVTTSDGVYKFYVLKGGAYTITPAKNNDIITNNGVTTGDIPLIRKQALTGNFLTSPYKIIAADANNSGLITTADVTFTRRVALNNTNTFPLTTSLLTYGRLWEFVPSDFIFSNPSQPFPFDKYRTYTNLLTTQTNQNFIGIKVGDVNNTWNPNIQ